MPTELLTELNLIDLFYTKSHPFLINFKRLCKTTD